MKPELTKSLLSSKSRSIHIKTKSTIQLSLSHEQPSQTSHPSYETNTWGKLTQNASSTLRKVSTKINRRMSLSRKNTQIEEDELENKMNYHQLNESTSIDQSEERTSISSYSSSQFRGRRIFKDLGLSSTFWPGVKHLRKMFRNEFDIFGKGEINQTQFKQGLEHMDFDVSNTDALNKLFREVDKNHNGLISEEAFLDVFRNMNRKKLEKKLAVTSSYIKKNPVRSTITSLQKPSNLSINTIIIDLGKHNRQGRFKKQYVAPEKISKKLSQKPHWTGHLRWLDFRGYDETAMELIVTMLKLPVAVLEDIQFEQRAKVEFYPNHQVLHIVTHAITLQNFPVERKRGELRLTKSKLFIKKKPKTVDVQIHIFIINNDTLVTYRKNHALDFLNNIWEDIIPQLQSHVFQFEGPFLMTSQSLATELLDDIAEHNWVTRDQFKDWKVALEKDIRKGTHPIHIKHILAIKQCSLVASNIFKPNAWMMNFLTSKKYINTPRVMFISAYLDDYRDVYESFTKLKDELEFTYTSCIRLTEFYKNQQYERMNTVLYLLTFITSIISPIQVITGIYGMNFDIMPELRLKYSYVTFWIGTVIIISTILLYTKKKRLL